LDVSKGFAMCACHGAPASPRSGAEQSKKWDVTVAVVGNPNVGKSTLFTKLTGEIVRIGNWPGVTVERKEGFRTHKGVRIRFVDLPGIYGLTATSPEELVARKFIVSGEPDLVLVLVDSTAPERTLYLAVQVLELTPNVVIVFTKADEADKRGIHVHVDKLESLLGVPVVVTSALKSRGLRELLDIVADFASGKRFRSEPLRVPYGGLEPLVSEVEEAVKSSRALSKYPSRWAALRLLEGDEDLESELRAAGEEELLEKVAELREAFARSAGRSPFEVVVAARYDFVRSVAAKTVVRVSERSRAEELFERILSTPLLGAAVAALLAFAAIFAAFTLNTGFPLNVLLERAGLEGAARAIEEYSLSGLISKGFDALSEAVEKHVGNSVLASLLVDGILPGAGALLSFAPLVLLVLAALAALDDSGILPRLAVAIDNFFNKFGLTGKALYPLVVSVGCNVPGVVATRAIEDERVRLSSIAAVPFIPCQARLLVILAIASAAFASPLAQAAAVASLYALGFAAFLLTGLLAGKLAFKSKEPPSLILEVPLIHAPSLTVVWWQTWDNTKHFLKRAGFVIFAAGPLMWLLLNLGPSGLAASEEESFAAALGKLFAPALAPLGLEAGAASVIAFSLVLGFFAKELYLEGLVMAAGTANVRETLEVLGIAPAQAYALLAFLTLYVPCFATLAAIYGETRSAKLAAASAAYMVALAYAFSLAAYALLSVAGLS